MYLVASDCALYGIFWKKQSASLIADLDSGSHSKILKMTILQLGEYFAGKRTSFSIPLSPEGTEYQKKVWQQLQRIPYGKTISYKELATALNDPKACRAVGSANGKNPLSIVIPCHRVIASDGKLAGYAGGVTTKSFLLNLEAQYR
jgi:methylated-DNA-[protein]-cysteine S-methyltransferase